MSFNSVLRIVGCATKRVVEKRETHVAVCSVNGVAAVDDPELSINILENVVLRRQESLYLVQSVEHSVSLKK